MPLVVFFALFFSLCRVLTQEIAVSNTIYCPSFDADSNSEFYSTMCYFRACAGLMEVGDCGNCSGTSVLRLYEEGGDLVAQSGAGCAYGCTFLSYLVPDSCVSYALEQSCDGSCLGQVKIAGMGVELIEDSSMNTVTCPLYFGVDAIKVFSTCSFIACGGTLAVDGCDPDRCLGTLQITLRGSAGQLLKTVNQTCAAAPRCQALSYSLPSGCRNYYIEQGCGEDDAYCVGELKISGSDVVLQETSTMFNTEYATSTCMPYATGLTSNGYDNIYTCNFTACSGLVLISGVDEMCFGKSKIRFYDSVYNEEITPRTLITWDCYAYLFEVPAGGCYSYTITEGCDEDSYCTGHLQVFGNASVVTASAGVSIDTAYYTTIHCPYFIGSAGDRPMHSSYNFTSCAGPLYVACSDCRDVSHNYFALYDSSTGTKVSGCMGFSCASFTYLVPEGCHSYTLIESARMFFSNAGITSVTGINTTLTVSSTVIIPDNSPSYTFTSAKCEAFMAYETGSGVRNYTMCNFTACAGPLSIDACNDFCIGSHLSRLLDKDGVQVAYDEGCAGLCTLIIHTVPAGCHEYTLIEGCYYDEFCAGRMTVSGSNVTIHHSTALPPAAQKQTLFTCPAYEATLTRNARTNTVDCVFTACGGEIVVNGCDENTCVGKQYVRLYDSSGTEIASDDGGCYARCAFLSVTLPSGCSTYTLAQGCEDKDSCGGVITIRGDTVSGGGGNAAPTAQLTDAPTEAPTTPECLSGFTYGVTSSGDRICYLEWASAFDYTDAITTCIGSESDLPTIDDEHAGEFLLSVQSSENQWLGLRYDHTVDQFRWPDGSNLTFSNWCAGQPDLSVGDCVVMVADASHSCAFGTWASSSCSAVYSFTCVIVLSYGDTDSSSTEDEPFPALAIYVTAIAAVVCAIIAYYCIRSHRTPTQVYPASKDENY